jgi:hypothetical protein
MAARVGGGLRGWWWRGGGVELEEVLRLAGGVISHVLESR